MKKFLSLTISLVTLNVFAWGSKGHSIVGEIAQRHIHWTTKIALKRILGKEKLADVANWPDFIRSDSHYAQAAYWHYVTIADGFNYETSEKNPKGDVVEAIARMSAIVKNKDEDKKNRIEAIKFLVHFIGDIHQPLHVGKPDDRGGNSVKVKWFGKEVNLHQVWDESIIDFQNISYTEYANRIDIIDNKTCNQWKKDDINVWINESMSYRPDVYRIGDGNLGYEYNFNNLAIVNMRLEQAGIRLAATLDKLLTLF